MSINSKNIFLIHKGLEIISKDFTEINVGELGNQKILSRDKNGKEFKKCTAKEWFVKLGSQHVSFDMNGLHGSISLDLCQEIPEKYCNMFDMVTNYGTTEHVENQLAVFGNIHKMTKEGGVMIHSIPLEGYWRGHCPFHYTLDFPEELSRLNNYILHYKDVERRGKEKLLNFILERKKNNFVGIERETITFSKNYKVNTDNLFN